MIQIKYNHYSKIPAGTGTVIFFLWTVVPLPSQTEQGFLMRTLVPWQRRHVDFIRKGPVVMDSYILKI